MFWYHRFNYDTIKAFTNQIIVIIIIISSSSSSIIMSSSSSIYQYYHYRNYKRLNILIPWESISTEHKPKTHTLPAIKDINHDCYLQNFPNIRHVS